MEKIKNWFIKHKKLWLQIVDILFALAVFFLGLALGSTYCYSKSIASAEELDTHELEAEDIQPPSILFVANYEDDSRASFPLIVPSNKGFHEYAGGWSLSDSLNNAYGYLSVNPIDGIGGDFTLDYYGNGQMQFPPTYKFVFNNIFTRFTDQFEWGHIETLNSYTTVIYQFEIYDFRNNEMDTIIFERNYDNGISYISLDITQLLYSWGQTQSPTVNNFNYFLTPGTPIAYLRTFTVTLIGSAQPDEYFNVYYLGNINNDFTDYFNRLQLRGDDKEEIGELFVFNSIVSAVDGFMSTEVLPNFSFYDILFITIGIPLTIWLLKLWLGG